MRFHMDSVQRVNVDISSNSVIFESQYVKSTVQYFTLSREQFHAFDDVWCIISRGNIQGIFPLGDDIYFNYHNDRGQEERQFVKLGRNDRMIVKFNFLSFDYYIHNVHRRILFILRWYEGRTRRTERTRRRAAAADRKKPSSRKRSLSDVCESTNKSTTSVDTCQGEITPRSSDHVLVSTADEASAILPQRGSSNFGRCDDSTVTETTLSADLQSPTKIQLLDCEFSI